MEETPVKSGKKARLGDHSPRDAPQPFYRNDIRQSLISAYMKYQ